MCDVIDIIRDKIVSVAGIGVLISIIALLLTIWGNVATNTREIGNLHKEIGDVRADTVTAIAANTVATEKGFSNVSKEIASLDNRLIQEILDNRAGLRILNYRLSVLEGKEQASSE